MVVLEIPAPLPLLADFLAHEENKDAVPKQSKPTAMSFLFIIKLKYLHNI
jgi:hypothetical protein